MAQNVPCIMCICNFKCVNIIKYVFMLCYAIHLDVLALYAVDAHKQFTMPNGCQ
jgi:hypothetical protein